MPILKGTGILCSAFVSVTANGSQRLPRVTIVRTDTGLEALDAVRRFGDKATMQRVVLEGFAESTSVLQETSDQEDGA